MWNFYRRHKKITFKVILQISPGSFLQGQKKMSQLPQRREPAQADTKGQQATSPSPALWCPSFQLLPQQVEHRAYQRPAQGGSTKTSPSNPLEMKCKAEGRTCLRSSFPHHNQLVISPRGQVNSIV